MIRIKRRPPPTGGKQNTRGYRDAEHGYWDSKAEYNYVQHLRSRLWDGVTHPPPPGSITDLVLHRVYPLVHNGVRLAGYEADAVYDEWTGQVWTLRIDDVKGMRTEVFDLKHKFLAAEGIEVRIIPASAWSDAALARAAKRAAKEDTHVSP